MNNGVRYAGFIDNEKGATGSFLKILGRAVGYAYVVYSVEGLAPTMCSAHFQPLILIEDERDS